MLLNGEIALKSQKLIDNSYYSNILRDRTKTDIINYNTQTSHIMTPLMTANRLRPLFVGHVPTLIPPKHTTSPPKIQPCPSNTQKQATAKQHTNQKNCTLRHPINQQGEEDTPQLKWALSKQEWSTKGDKSSQITSLSIQQEHEIHLILEVVLATGMSSKMCTIYPKKFQDKSKKKMGGNTQIKEHSTPYLASLWSWQHSIS